MDRRPSEMSEESGTSPARQADHSPQTSPRAGRRSVLSSVSGCPSDSENSWGQAPRRKLHAEFHKVEQKTKSGHLSEAESGWLRAKVAYVLDSDTLVNCMVVTILVDSVCALIDTDYRAMKLDVPVYSEVISITCLGIYTLELSALLWVNGASALKKKSILFDAFTLACGYLAISIRAFEAFGQPLPSDLTFLKDLRLLRMVRVMRVARVIQRTRWLKELKKLVSMMATCMKTLGWSFIFCFAFMTFWAMMVVEFVHPLVEQMQTERLLNCEECVRHTSSIMEANLLLFKTVIAGDSWGKIAVPVIQYSPATAIIFCGSLMTTVFGVLNMVIAVVVDSFADSRQRDVLNLAEELEQENENDKKYLQSIFNRLDLCQNGFLTLEDLVKGARTDPEFQSRLRVMDIDEADLEQLFEMIDVDHSGEVSPDEFISPLSRWIHDSKTAPRFVKYNIDRSLHAQEEILKQSHQHFSILASRLDELCELFLPHERADAEWQSSPGVMLGLYGYSEDKSMMMRTTVDASDAGDIDAQESEIEQPQLSCRGLGEEKADFGVKLQAKGRAAKPKVPKSQQLLDAKDAPRPDLRMCQGEERQGI